MSAKELTDQDFQKEISRQKLAFVDIYASWCGPCKLFSPIFDQVSTTSPHAFFKIDGDLNPQCRSEMRIDNLPFVAAFRDGKFIKGVSTSTEAGLKEFILEMENGR